jgi:hypothetical protein
MQTHTTDIPLSGVVWGLVIAAPFWAIVIWLLAH